MPVASPFLSQSVLFDHECLPIYTGSIQESADTVVKQLDPCMVIVAMYVVERDVGFLAAI